MRTKVDPSLRLDSAGSYRVPERYAGFHGETEAKLPLGGSVAIPEPGAQVATAHVSSRSSSVCPPSVSLLLGTGGLCCRKQDVEANGVTSPSGQITPQVPVFRTRFLGL